MITGACAPAVNVADAQYDTFVVLVALPSDQRTGGWLCHARDTHQVRVKTEVGIIIDNNNTESFAGQERVKTDVREGRNE